MPATSRMREREKKRRKKVAWGIAGSGDRLAKTVDIMKEIRHHYQSRVDIVVYLSKAGDQVVKWYKLADDLNESFDRILVEMDSNLPFLAGELQTGKFEFLLIAPATSNTVAKISLGIADTLLCNAAIMGLKAFVPLYIMPSDYKEGTVLTRLPDGRDMKLRIRKEDALHVKKLIGMEDVFVLREPEDIHSIFKRRFRPR